MGSTERHTGSTVSDPTPRMPYDEWFAEGERRFGKELMQWKFVCPICGNVAAINDYRPYKDQGADTDSATNQCIGRFVGTPYKAFGASAKERGKPCDYALFGLFKLPGVIVLMPDGKERLSFAFAEVTA